MILLDETDDFFKTIRELSINRFIQKCISIVPLENHLDKSAKLICRLIELIQEGIDVNSQKNVTQKTPLHLATEQELTEVIQMLLDKNAKVDLQNNEGITAMHAAITVKNFEIYNMLFNKSRKINIKNKKEETPLFLIKRRDKNSDKFLKSVLKQIINTIIRLTSDKRFYALQQEKQLFTDIEKHFQVKHDTVKALINWIINSPIYENIQDVKKIPNDDRRKIVEWFETLYSNFQMTSKQSLCFELLNEIHFPEPPHESAPILSDDVSLDAQNNSSSAQHESTPTLDDDDSLSEQSRSSSTESEPSRCSLMPWFSKLLRFSGFALSSPPAQPTPSRQLDRKRDNRDDDDSDATTTKRPRKV